MADPTIQTFCCHSGNGSYMATNVMNEFNSDAYNAVCLFSSILGILGSIYQILPREQYANNHRWLSFSAARGRKIIVCLAISDLMASLGIFLRSSLWLNYKNIMPAVDDEASVWFCAVSSAWTQYFYTATWIWTLCYAIDMRLILADKESHTKIYHLVAWTVPAILTTIGLSLLYFPNANCHNPIDLTDKIIRILPNYIATYIPIAIVMIANPWLYMSSCKDMERYITCSYSQFTSRERDIIDAIKVKFLVINLVFYICWIPNLINGLLLWILWFNLPIQFIVTVWYIMAFTNPLQALFNCLVYRRWNKGSERLILPWRKSESKEKILIPSEERYPLLHPTPRNSINGYKTYN
ncbi:PREDICTED: G-protein coupled receptor 143-like [Nicrophorus vespilloides]|uniref:G-protein coupled receptor 143-like n=1 Tax=Nicrophorus vespilloides TaxID=110193 RepID=A0ABM1MCW3_NICVS|nr:PREDICTED: G-protein coupled receptor 143-like [Nicrophorus vespilloides]